jgi:hypothetical protein
VLVPLFFAVPDFDYFSASTASTIFGWLLLFLSTGTDGLALLCTPLAFLTALCSSLRGLGHLFNQFPDICIYFNTVLFLFGSIVGEPTSFSFIRLTASSSF